MKSAMRLIKKVYRISVIKIVNALIYKLVRRVNDQFEGAFF